MPFTSIAMILGVATCFIYKYIGYKLFQDLKCSRQYIFSKYTWETGKTGEILPDYKKVL